MSLGAKPEEAPPSVPHDVNREAEQKRARNPARPAFEAFGMLPIKLTDKFCAKPPSDDSTAGCLHE